MTGSSDLFQTQFDQILKHRQRRGQCALRVRDEATILTNNQHAPGGQFVLDTKALPIAPTLVTRSREYIQKLTR